MIEINLARIKHFFGIVDSRMARLMRKMDRVEHVFGFYYNFYFISLRHIIILMMQNESERYFVIDGLFYLAFL